MKKLLFLTTFDYPSKFAHPLHGLDMANAFQFSLGNNFLFIINTIKDVNLLKEINFLRPFGVHGRFIKKIHLRLVGYFIWLPCFFIKHKDWNDSEAIVFLNDPILMIIVGFFSNFFRYNIIFESHGEYNKFLRFFVFHFANKIIFVTNGLLDNALVEHAGLKDKCIVLSNAVDVDKFIIEKTSKIDLRKKLNLPIKNFIIGYTGRLKPLGMDKGGYFIINYLSYLPVNFCALFVGGTKKEIEEYYLFVKEKKLENRVYFVEHVEKEVLFQYTKACDLLAYVPEVSNNFFEKETSPMKIFEYMASKNPIIVSDLHTTREILDEESAFFINPGDNLKFIELVKYIYYNREQAQNKAFIAFDKVKNNTWLKRAQTIIDLL